MIDWWGLVRNALWVLGLALALATVSVASYLAGRQGLRLRDKLSEPSYEIPLNLGLALFCLGLLFSGRTWWEQALWGLAAASFGGLAVWRWWRSHSREEQVTGHDPPED